MPRIVVQRTDVPQLDDRAVVTLLGSASFEEASARGVDAAIYFEGADRLVDDAIVTLGSTANAANLGPSGAMTDVSRGNSSWDEQLSRGARRELDRSPEAGSPRPRSTTRTLRG